MKLQPMTRGSLTILLADAQEIYREGLKQVLIELAGQVQIMEASNYTELFSLADTLTNCDIVLLDYHMQDLPGDLRMAVRMVVRRFSHAPVVLLSGLGDTARIAAFLRIGARGFLPKSIMRDSLIHALNFILEGGTYVSPLLLDTREWAPETSDVKNHSPQQLLTPAEMIALASLMQGMTNKEIAKRVNLAEITVKKQLGSLYRKIGASNRLNAVRIAVELGLYERLSKSTP